MSSMRFFGSATRKSVAALAAALAVAACSGGGGGGGGSFDDRAQLLSVIFPDPGNVNPEAEQDAPQDSPLVQQIVLTFSGSPDPNRISTNTIQVRDSSNLPVPGTFDVDGSVVTFTPRLPLRPASVSGSGAVDTGGTGLQPGAQYTVRVGPSSFGFVANSDAALKARFPDPLDPNGILITFKTTENVPDFFSGLPSSTPALVSADPVDGETGVSPNLYTDPDDLFPPRRTFTLTFDHSLNPDPTNVGDATIRLIDLDDRPAGFPNGLPLGVDIAIVENEVDHSVVRVSPSGILPFGHLLSLEYPLDLKSLSDTGVPAGVTGVATTFTIADAPAGPIRDAIVENFDDLDAKEQDTSQLATGDLPADWDVNDSNVLQAAFAFKGDGVLGEFKPPAPPPGDTRVVTLDTTQQVFPLPDGSTPNAPPGFAITGGVFPFTDIDIPDGIVLKPLGPNPLILTATGSVRIAGEIILAGENGTPENAYDSAVTSVPGGAGIGGGGRGGESHPIEFYPADQISYLTLVSPRFGGSGFGIDPVDGAMKRIGGTGGECGALDAKDGSGKYMTNQEISPCGVGQDEFRGSHANEKVPGGGGGSMLEKGFTPTNKTTKKRLNGVGNVRPDGTGRFKADDDKSLLCGVGGLHPFFDDGNTNNDFYGTKGQLTRVIGGQGGGGGATLTESYYCGIWCDKDDDTTNNSVCGQSPDFPPPQTRGDSVGDSRGGGGGLLIQALGSLLLEGTAKIDASGGDGMGGEALGCSYWGAGGGGGAGGMVVFQSGTSIDVNTGALIDVRAGIGDNAENDNFYFTCDDGTSDGDPGDAGAGGAGLIQLQVPAGQTATVTNPTGSIRPSTSWIDPTNTLNPVEFTPRSVALSVWFDLGRATARPPANTNPTFTVGGIDAGGFVITGPADANGFEPVLNPAATDLVVGYLGQRDPLTNFLTYKQGEEPRADVIPDNATVQVEFQGADPIVEGSKEIDPATITAWSPTPSVADGMKFIRWRITFDVTANGDPFAPGTRLPAVQSATIHAEF